MHVTGVLTQHNDASRTGTIRQRGFDASVVASAQWGLVQRLDVDGTVWAQPLFAFNVRRPGGAVRHIVVVVTARNTLYGFDGSTYELLWMTPLGRADSSDWLPPYAGLGCSFLSPGSFQPEGEPAFQFMGVLSTPAVDPSTGKVYVSYRTGGATAASAQQWLAAVDLATGEVLGATQTGQQPGFRLEHHRQRASLLLSHGLLFLAFASRCEDPRPHLPKYHGWVFAHDAQTLEQVGSYNCTPTSAGGGIWQASGGLAADEKGRVFLMTGNTQDGVGVDQKPDATGTNLGNSFVRLDVTTVRRADGTIAEAQLGVGSWFTPYRAEWQSSIDLDLGSSGPVLIPGTRYVAGGGKEGVLYLLDVDELGGLAAAPTSALPKLPATDQEPYTPNDPSHDQAVFEIQAGRNPTDKLHMGEWGPFPHIHGSPVYVDLGNGRRLLYVWPEKDYLKGFELDGGKLRLVLEGRDRAPQTIWKNGKLESAAMPGGMLSATVDPQRPGRGIVFASVPQDAYGDRGAFRAYDAATLERVWESAETKARSYRFAKFAAPTIADERVFLPTFSGEVFVYGRRDSWQGPAPFGWPTLPAGAHVAVQQQSATELTAVAVDKSGSLNVAWVVGGGAWVGPVPIGAPTFPPGGPVALATQANIQLTAAAVDIYGRLNLAWVGPDGLWHGPVPLSANVFPPGAAVAMEHQQSMDQLNILAVDKAGAVNVAWTHLLEPWEGPAPIAVTPPGFAPPGGHIAVEHQDSFDRLDALVVDSTGAVSLIWTRGLDPWQGPERKTARGFAPPGAPIAMEHQVSMDQLDALVVDNTGALNVLWVPKLDKRWLGPGAMTPPGFTPPGAHIAMGHPASMDQLDALIVDTDGAINVLSAHGLERWSEAGRISPTTFPAGAPVAVAHQSDKELDLLAVDGSGRLSVSWVNSP